MHQETQKGGVSMITFPTTAEAFTAYQKQLTEQPLDALTLELISEYVELFNMEFNAGLKGREPTDIVKDAARFFTRGGKPKELEKPPLRRFFACVQYWCSEAYRQGKEARQEREGG